MDTIFRFVLVLNLLWFGAGFWKFMIRSRAAARLVLPRSARELEIVETVAGVIRFIGGLNLGFAVLSAAGLMLGRTAFIPGVAVALLFAFTVAHVSQFAVNAPFARLEARGVVPVWPVLRGTMLVIFVVDGVLTLLNGSLALAYLVIDRA